MRAAREPHVRAKVCGVMSPGDARVVASAGADYLGVILSPGFSRSVPPERAREIYDAAAPAQRVGVFVNAEAPHMAAAARDLSLDVVQLSGGEPPAVVAVIAAAGPWQVWKTVHAKAGVAIAASAGPYVGGLHAGGPDAVVADGFLLDAWDPSRPGGTGRTFAWAGVGAEVREVIGSATFIAAGGMTPENAGAAVEALSPDVLDVSSGVESALGAKDPRRTRAFVEAVRGAAARG